MVAVVDNRSFVVDVRCVQCRIMYSIILNRSDLVDWLGGSGPIEKILHYLTAGERELLLSNICDCCFEKMFSDLDNDE